MVVIDVEEQADRLFGALADSTRRDILRQAMDGEHSVSALSRNYAMSLPAVQKHVGVLERAGLVTKHRRGREQIVRCNLEAIRTAARLLDELEARWLDRLDRFADVLSDPDPSDPGDRP